MDMSEVVIVNFSDIHFQTVPVDVEGFKVGDAAEDLWFHVIILDLGTAIEYTAVGAVTPNQSSRLAYERLDLGKTWESYEEDVKEAINETTHKKVQIEIFKDFEAWVTDYGNPDGRFAAATNASPTHFRTIQMWKAIDESRSC
ncbi:hypothetical protein N8T08_002212 [Aspergillus melleus]|uniref:Uncharacterized protein n=1 Tax=Aspergillus melleus TaxID=138277 RepID=A0ACC3B8F7_9EURO|nr:hypothetical protein N8T08_002212 [Aspergillus melleus]